MECQKLTALSPPRLWEPQKPTEQTGSKVHSGSRNVFQSPAGAGGEEIAQIIPSCLASPKLQTDSAMNLVKPMQVTCLGEEIRPVCQKAL